MLVVLFLIFNRPSPPRAEEIVTAISLHPEDTNRLIPPQEGTPLEATMPTLTQGKEDSFNSRYVTEII